MQNTCINLIRASPDTKNSDIFHRHFKTRIIKTLNHSNATNFNSSSNREKKCYQTHLSQSLILL